MTLQSVALGTVFLLTAIVAASCATDKSPPASTKTSSPPEAAPVADTSNSSCRERIGVLRNRLLATATVGIEGHVQIGTPPRASAGQTSWLPGPIIVIEAQDLAGNQDDARMKLAHLFYEESLERKQTGKTRPFYLVVPGSAKATSVAALLKPIPSDAELRFVVILGKEKKRERLSDRVEEVLSEIDNSKDPNERAVKTAEFMSKAVRTCAPVVRVFGNLAALRPVRKHTVLIEKIPAAVEACDCRGLDVDLMEGLLLSSLRYGPKRGWVAIDKKRLRSKKSIERLIADGV